jgi:4-amino-4-deoxy-L-arabinose transferase-like glycosyltransferase
MFKISENKTLFILLIILAIASFFRLWQLDIIPPGLYPDEAINGNEAISNPGKVFYHENNGREGLFINLLFLSFSLFGISIWSLKIVGALAGIFTVWGLYLLTRELFNKNIALLSSFFLAVSFWHLNFSRIGFRAILIPFILVFGFYFLFRGFKQKRILDLIIAGIFFGFGFYTYISYRFIVLLLLLILLCWWFIYNQERVQKKYWRLTAFLLLSIIIIALPIGIYFLQNPGDFVSRAGGVSVFTQENPVKALGESLILHLGMFNFYGDNNWRHNFAGSPQLLWPVGILFLIGFALSIKDFLTSIKNKNYSGLKFPLLLLSWFFIMLLPGVLTYEGLPHALRVIGVIPVVYIFAGLGGWTTYQWFKGNTEYRKLLVFTSLLFLFTVAFIQYNKYFIKWGRNPEVLGAFSRNYVEMGNYLNSLPQGTQKYVIVNQPGIPAPWPDGIPVPAQTPIFIERTKFGQPEATYLLPSMLNEIKINKKTTVVVLMKYDEVLINELSEKFPEEEIKIISF